MEHLRLIGTSRPSIITKNRHQTQAFDREFRSPNKFPLFKPKHQLVSPWMEFLMIHSPQPDTMPACLVNVQ